MIFLHKQAMKYMYNNLTDQGLSC